MPLTYPIATPGVPRELGEDVLDLPVAQTASIDLQVGQAACVLGRVVVDPLEDLSRMGERSVRQSLADPLVR
jgi:hypothetical protein